MVAANKSGPIRSQIVLEKPKPDSTKADAHCAIDNSDAPEQIIKTTAIQKSGDLNSCKIVIPFPSSTRCSIGHVAKLYMLYKGMIAQKQATNFQLLIPKIVKSSVEIKVTPTHPQQ